MSMTSMSDDNNLMETSVGRALWISSSEESFQESCVSLIARMRDRLVKLSVPLCEEFKARVQHVDMFACRICVFPLIASKYRTELHKALSHLVGLDETPERPVNVNSKVVYLVRGDVENGKPFRGVVTEEKPAGRYKVFDVDSGMVKTVAITDIIQLPLALCYIPPLVICMAVPPSAVDAQSPERIKEDSLVICRFKPVPLLCVQDAYPPVLLCDVRMDGAHAVSVNIEAAEVRSQLLLRDGFPGRSSSSRLKSASSAENLWSAKEHEKMAFVRLPAVERRPFPPYSVALPYRLMARVTERVFENFYWMRDTTLLTALHEHVKHPLSNIPVAELSASEATLGCIARVSRMASVDAQRANRSRLYRGMVMRFDSINEMCSVYLVDYGQSIHCRPEAVFDLTDQPIEVRRLPSASFAVRIKGAGSGRRVHMKTPMLKEEEEYSVRLVAQDSDGCYFGTVSTPSSRPVYSRHEMGSSVRTYAPKERPETMANEERKRIMEQRRENVRRGEETIAETADSLRRERELFETAKSKREQDIALMTMQLQIANISRKLDEITTNSVPNAIAFGVGAYPLRTPLQLGSTYAQQQLQSQELQQSNQYAGKNSAEQNDGTMQQILCTQQNGTAVASCSSLPTFASARRAQTNVILVPTMQHPRSAGHCSASSTSTISSDLMRDSIGQQAQVRGKSQSRESLITSTAYASEIMRREPTALSHAGTAQVGKASFGRLSLKSRLTSTDLSSEYGQPNSTVACRRRMDVSHHQLHTEYGEPPKHPLIEYECANLSTKGSNSGSTRHQNSSKNSAVKRSSKERHDRKHGLRPHTCLGNCSSDMRSEVEHSAHATGDHVRCVLSAQSTTTIGSNRTEILHHVHPRDRDGNVLCSSSESSDEGMGMEQSQSEKEGDGGGGKTKACIIDSLISDTQISTPISSDSASTIVSNVTDHVTALKYVQYVKHVEMERGRTYVVKRSDEDYCNKNWPLFFVQIQENEQLHFMEQYLDSLQLQSDLPDDRVVVGTLCACYCNAFGAVFRAVITDVSDERVEVLYVDYGNYEVVDRKQLKSVDDQPEVIRTCAAMGIPCILSDVDSALTEGGNVEIQADVIAAMQMKVACSLEQFTLRFLRQRSDGVNTVEVVQKEHVRSSKCS